MTFRADSHGATPCAGIPLTEAEPLLLASIIFTLFAAVNEGSGKFVDEE
jgi:photosystem II 22kDa protein